MANDLFHPPAIIRRAKDLTGLAAAINMAHRQAGQALRASLEHALRVGELLIQAKAKVGYGQWLDWLRENCEVSERLAQKYMQVARDQERLRQAQRAMGVANPPCMADLTFADAMDLAAENSTRMRGLTCGAEVDAHCAAQFQRVMEGGVSIREVLGKLPAKTARRVERGFAPRRRPRCQ
jgi:hypothetical protein